MWRSRAQVLLELGSSANYRDSKELTPLYHAVSRRASLAVVDMLLHDHALVNIRNEERSTELHVVGAMFYAYFTVH